METSHIESTFHSTNTINNNDNQQAFTENDFHNKNKQFEHSKAIKSTKLQINQDNLKKLTIENVYDDTKSLSSYISAETQCTSINSSFISFSEDDTIVTTINKDRYKYIGETRKNKREGFGICYYTNGDKYTGMWKDDKKEGHGVLKLKDGKIFKGIFFKNTVDGFVEYTNNNIIHLGVMKDYKFVSGEAIVIRSKHTYFEGVMTLIGNKLCGLGKQNYSNKNYYEGEVEEYNECGWGMLKRADNFIFKGEKKNKGYNGYCEIYYPDTNRFYGYFTNNKRNGLGVSLIKKKSAISVGNYIDDVKDGGHLTVSDDLVQFELWIKGFRSKTIINMENIQKYVSVIYPEYQWLLSVNVSNLLKIFN